MNWNNYLSENKSPISNITHLGVIEGTVKCPFDISELPSDSKIISMSTPRKKFKLKYTNLDSLIGNECIEAICLNDITEDRLKVFSTLANLKYLHISTNKQESIPNLSVLKSLKVLILSGVTKVNNIDFIKGLKTLQTLYIYGMNNLYDLTPLEDLNHLKELDLSHGKMSGVGKAIKSMDPLSKLINLEYLNFGLNVENKNYDISPLLNLTNLKQLYILPRYLKKGQDKTLIENLPFLDRIG